MSRRVGPHEALALMQDGWVYVDVRSVPEFERGHPRGAFNVPLLDLHPALGGLVPNPAFIATIEHTFGKGARLVIGCQMGVRSERAVEMLLDAGFSHVVDQHPGWDGSKDARGRLLEPGWAKLGLPAETDADDERTWSALRRGT